MNIFRGVFFLLFLGASVAHAEVTYPEYKKLISDPRLINYVDGAGKGIAWANTALRTDGKPPLYCPPDSVVFSVDDYIKAIDKKAQSVAAVLGEKILQTTPIEFLLTRGMIESYPCRGK